MSKTETAPSKCRDRCKDHRITSADQREIECITSECECKIADIMKAAELEETTTGAAAAKKEAEAMAAILLDTFMNLHQRLMIAEEKISNLEQEKKEHDPTKK